MRRSGLLSAFLLSTSIVSAPGAATADSFFRSELKAPIFFSQPGGDQQVVAPAMNEIGTLEAVVDMPFSFTPTLSAGSLPLDWSISPEFPVGSGLSISATDGTISGKPLVAASYGTFSASARNDGGRDEEAFDLIVYSKLASIDTEIKIQASMPLDRAVEANGGKTPYAFAWAPDSAPRPPWLDLKDGRLTGTPAAGTTTGLKISITDQLGQPATRSFDLVVEALSSIIGWGFNYGGSLGTGETATVKRSPLTLPHLSGMSQISGYLDASCGLQDSSLYCWGSNSQGQIGVGDHAASLTPRLVGTGYSAVAAGVQFACGIKSGDVYCWGDASKFQLGSGSTTSTTEPTKVNIAGKSFVAIHAVDYAVCAATAEFEYWCWGDNPHGEIPTSTASITSPTQIHALAGYEVLSLGEYHGCGIKGSVASCWSKSNAWGQMGSGPRNSGSFNPVSLGSGWTWIDTGSTISCGKQSGVVKCWGSNEYGQFGNASTGIHASPVSLPGLSQYENLAVGAHFMCGIKDAEAYCWGINSEGYVGNGSTQGTFGSPQKVVGGHKVSRLIVERQNVFALLK